MKHVVSFSGGRTSAYLVHLMEQKRKNEGWDVDYIFMDTGAEHPKTYEFIRNVVKHWQINIVCLHGDFKQPIGEGHAYKIVSANDIKFDPVNGPYGEMMRKYGVPTITSAWCTSRMKEETHDKYCDDIYGKGNYVTWLGIRADEPERLKIGKRDNLRYLAEISDFDKQDILQWWQKQQFDLGIDEHLGNCVFCFKKSSEKIALAARDEPDLFAQWDKSLNLANDRNTEFYKSDLLGQQSFSRQKKAQHRGRMTAHDIIQVFSSVDTEQLREIVYKNSKLSTWCNSSCEPFSQEELDL